MSDHTRATAPDQPSRTAEPRSAVGRGGGLPRDNRLLALTGIFLLAIFHTLYVAKTLVFPILLAVLAYFCLTPIVRLLQRLFIPPPLGAAVVVIALIGALVSGVYLLSTPAKAWAGRLPTSLTRIEYRLRLVRQPIEKLIAATDRVEKMAKVDGSAEQIEVRGFSLAETILGQTRNVLLTAATVLVLLYFLLASGGEFVRNAAMAFPQIRDKTEATTLINRTESEISRYLLTVSVINACLGLLTAIVLYLLDMPNPVLWGVCAGMLNFIPFLGAAALTVILFGVALLHYGSVGAAVIPPTLFATMSALEGMVITPLVLGRRLALSPVAVFTSLLIWSWLWGIPGALISVPTLAAIKIACDQVESLKGLGTILGR